MLLSYLVIIASIIVIVLLIHALNDREIAKTYFIRFAMVVFIIESLRVMV